MKYLAATLACGVGVLLAGAALGQVIGERDGSEVVTVRVGSAGTGGAGQLVFPGVSAKTAGAKSLSLKRIAIPPGGQEKPHIHRGYEMAIYVVQGRVETRYGNGLKKSIENVAGDFIFIPPDVPHQARNLSATEPAVAIVARSDANERENLELYEPVKK